MNQDNWADLHIHTKFSDGLLSPTDMVNRAKTLGLSAIGIVDHDTVSGLPEAVEAGQKADIEIVPGVELSSQHKNRDIHLIGFYMDVDYPELVRYLNLFQEERSRRAQKMVMNLQNQGVDIAIEDVLEKTKGSSVGRPHIAEVLMEKGYVETFQDAFRRYIGYGASAYEDKYRINPNEAIRIIAEAQGISILAHPASILNDSMILDLVQSGLNGIEVVHPNLTEERTHHLMQIVQEHQLVISGGSDCHGGRTGEISMGRYTVPLSTVEKIKERRRELFG